ncbi:MAG: hypothetical protein ACLFVU_14390 [Phycisphaerae bacterium]
MKNALIAVLVCVNVALLVGLVFGSGAVDDAKAQVVIGQDYMLVTGKIDQNEDAVYITDLKKKQMLAFKYDRRQEAMVPFRGVRLLREFNRQMGR